MITIFSPDRKTNKNIKIKCKGKEDLSKLATKIINEKKMKEGL